MEDQEIVLTYAEKVSPLWTKLRTHMEARLDYAQRRLEQSIPEQDTNVIRGEIAALRHLIRLEEDVPVTEDADPSHL